MAAALQADQLHGAPSVPSRGGGDRLLPEARRILTTRSAWPADTPPAPGLGNGISATWNSSNPANSLLLRAALLNATWYRRRREKQPGDPLPAAGEAAPCHPRRGRPAAPGPRPDHLVTQYQTRSTSSAIIGSSFFLYLAHTNHWPLSAVSRQSKQPLRRWSRRSIGAWPVLETVRAAARASNVVIFTSDNGGPAPRQRPLRGHGNDLGRRMRADDRLVAAHPRRHFPAPSPA